MEVRHLVKTVVKEAVIVVAASPVLPKGMQADQGTGGSEPLLANETDGRLERMLAQEREHDLEDLRQVQRVEVGEVC